MKSEKLLFYSVAYLSRLNDKQEAYIKIKILSLFPKKIKKILTNDFTILYI